MHLNVCRTDLERVCSIVEECGELWASPGEWQLHLARSAESLVGGFTGLFMFSSRERGRSRVLEYATVPRTHVPFGEFLETGGEMLVPGALDAFAALTADGLFCGSFASLSPAYHRSEFYQRFMRPQEAYDTLCALASAQGSTHVNLSLSRAPGETEFSDRDRDLLAALVGAVARRIGKRLTTRSQIGAHGLSARERQTLDGILAGDGEKQIAARLDLSHATVHQYVTSIYRHFSVSSRGELMAYFVKRVPRGECPK